MNILELVTFRLADGINEADFLEVNEHLNTWVKEQPGFAYRALAKAEDGSWTDSVYWSDLENAKAAQAAFGEQPELMPMMTMIAPDSVNVTHQTIHVKVAGN